MSTSTRNIILWIFMLFLVGIGSFFMSKTTKEYIVEVGLHTTYNWLAGSSSILQGDGQTHLYLKSDSGNFTVYDQDGLYVTFGQPLAMMPGDTKQTFIADFELITGKKYTLSDNSADIYTITPTKLHFYTYRYGFVVISVLCVVLLFFTLIIL